MLESHARPVRPSAIAGTWYPGSPAALRRAIEGYLAAAEPIALPGRLLALVSPHAGYTYSGPVAARAYAQLRNVRPPISRVVLLGPLHRPIRGGRVGSFMVPTEAMYRTPLGDVLLDDQFIAALGQRVSLTRVQGDEEHSLEIQLPFLQSVLGDVTLVPIMLGDYIGDPSTLGRLDPLATALAELADNRTLLICSTDLSHLDSYAEVKRIDQKLVDLISRFDVEGLCSALHSEQVQACGGSALVTAMRAAQQMGATGARVLTYSTSGDITGDQRLGTYTVGYLSAVVYA